MQYPRTILWSLPETITAGHDSGAWSLDRSQRYPTWLRGGYYDRLRSDPTWAEIPAWVILHSCCLSEPLLPRDPWDIPFSGWICEKGAGRPSAETAS